MGYLWIRMCFWNIFKKKIRLYSCVITQTVQGVVSSKASALHLEVMHIFQGWGIFYSARFICSHKQQPEWFGGSSLCWPGIITRVSANHPKVPHPSALFLSPLWRFPSFPPFQIEWIHIHSGGVIVWATSEWATSTWLSQLPCSK